MKTLLDRLNRRIIIQEKKFTNDEQGGFIETWINIKTTWAEIKPINTLSDLEANRISENISHLITIRYFEPLTTECRIIYQDRIFMIKSVINIMESNKIQEIIAEEELRSTVTIQN